MVQHYLLPQQQQQQTQAQQQQQQQQHLPQALYYAAPAGLGFDHHQQQQQCSSTGIPMAPPGVSLYDAGSHQQSAYMATIAHPQNGFPHAAGNTFQVAPGAELQWQTQASQGTMASCEPSYPPGFEPKDSSNGTSVPGFTDQTASMAGYSDHTVVVPGVTGFTDQAGTIPVVHPVNGQVPVHNHIQQPLTHVHPYSMPFQGVSDPHSMPYQGIPVQDPRHHHQYTYPPPHPYSHPFCHTSSQGHPHQQDPQHMYASLTSFPNVANGYAQNFQPFDANGTVIGVPVMSMPSYVNGNFATPPRFHGPQQVRQPRQSNYRKKSPTTRVPSQYSRNTFPLTKYYRGNHLHALSPPIPERDYYSDRWHPPNIQRIQGSSTGPPVDVPRVSAGPSSAIDAHMLSSSNQPNFCIDGLQNSNVHIVGSGKSGFLHENTNAHGGDFQSPDMDKVSSTPSDMTHDIHGNSPGGSDSTKSARHDQQTPTQDTQDRSDCLQHQCDPCRSSFLSPSALNDHLKTHMRCGINECSFEASGKVIEEHRITEHGYAMESVSKSIMQSGGKESKIGVTTLQSMGDKSDSEVIDNENDKEEVDQNEAKEVNNESVCKSIQFGDMDTEASDVAPAHEGLGGSFSKLEIKAHVSRKSIFSTTVDFTSERKRDRQEDAGVDRHSKSTEWDSSDDYCGLVVDRNKECSEVGLHTREKVSCTQTDGHLIRHGFSDAKRRCRETEESKLLSNEMGIEPTFTSVKSQELNAVHTKMEVEVKIMSEEETLSSGERVKSVILGNKRTCTTADDSLSRENTEAKPMEIAPAQEELSNHGSQPVQNAISHEVSDSVAKCQSSDAESLVKNICEQHKKHSSVASENISGLVRENSYLLQSCRFIVNNSFLQLTPSSVLKHFQWIKTEKQINMLENCEAGNDIQTNMDVSIEQEYLPSKSKHCPGDKETSTTEDEPMFQSSENDDPSGKETNVKDTADVKEANIGQDSEEIPEQTEDITKEERSWETSNQTVADTKDQFDIDGLAEDASLASVLLQDFTQPKDPERDVALQQHSGEGERSGQCIQSSGMVKSDNLQNQSLVDKNTNMHPYFVLDSTYVGSDKEVQCASWKTFYTEPVSNGFKNDTRSAFLLSNLDSNSGPHAPMHYVWEQSNNDGHLPYYDIDAQEVASAISSGMVDDEDDISQYINFDLHAADSGICYD